MANKFVGEAAKGRKTGKRRRGRERKKEEGKRNKKKRNEKVLSLNREMRNMVVLLWVSPTHLKALPTQQ